MFSVSCRTLYQDRHLSLIQSICKAPSRLWQHSSLPCAMFLFKTLKNKSPDYLFRIIPQRRSSHITRNSDKIPLFKVNHNFYKNSFFSSTTIGWNNLDQNLRSSKSYTLFLHPLSTPMLFVYQRKTHTHEQLEQN